MAKKKKQAKVKKKPAAKGKSKKVRKIKRPRIKMAAPLMKKRSRAGRKFKKLPRRELKEFQKMLTELREEIAGEIEHINKEARSNFRESSGDLSFHTFHMADIADENFAKELNLELASNEREILMAINEALRRIESGAYGMCVDCECGIPKSRLRVIPYTQLCRKCQEEREKRMPGF